MNNKLLSKCNLIIFILITSLTIKFLTRKLAQMQNARSGKLEILLLNNISKTQKGLSSCIPLDSDCSLVAFIEVECAYPCPEVLVAEVVLELCIEEDVLVLAQLYVFLYVALAVHFGLEVQRFIRERNFKLVHLLYVVFVLRLVQVESCFVVHDRTRG